MQTSLEILSAVMHTVLITVTWGTHTARYCRSTVDIVSNGQTFMAMPSLKVLMDKAQHGGTDDAEIEVQILGTVEPFDGLSGPYVFAKTTIVVEEMVVGDDASRQEIFTGQIAKTTCRPSTDKIIKCKVVGVKRHLVRPVGIQALTTCVWGFCDAVCDLDIATFTHAGTVTTLNQDSISNRVFLTIPGGPDLINWKWARGYVEVDGLRITIRKSFTDGRFELRDIPPPSWAGQTCIVVEGCDKQISTCAGRNNTEHFCGAGYAMPVNNPIIQE